MEQGEQDYETKLADLRAAIKEGEDSGVAETGSFVRVRRKFNLPPIEIDAPEQTGLPTGGPQKPD
jgi:hypothetical protein